MVSMAWKDSQMLGLRVTYNLRANAKQEDTCHGCLRDLALDEHSDMCPYSANADY